MRCWTSCAKRAWRLTRDGKTMTTGDLPGSWTQRAIASNCGSRRERQLQAPSYKLQGKARGGKRAARNPESVLSTQIPLLRAICRPVFPDRTDHAGKDEAQKAHLRA